MHLKLLAGSMECELTAKHRLKRDFSGTIEDNNCLTSYKRRETSTEYVNFYRMVAAGFKSWFWFIPSLSFALSDLIGIIHSSVLSRLKACSFNPSVEGRVL